MKMILASQMTKLLKNGNASAASEGGIDHKPVIKLFNPVGAATWLISEIDPHNPDVAFGLCDLGAGTPELGYVSLSELFALRLRFNQKIERDMHFTADKTLGEYAKEARSAGRIVY
jgi:hypothetical protein